MEDRNKFRVFDKNGIIHSRRLKVIDGEVYIYFIIDNRYEYQKDQNRFIIEQCTGFKDNNNKGNLIYWGDIIYIAGQGNVIMDEKGVWELQERIYNGTYDDVEKIISNIHKEKSND